MQYQCEEDDNDDENVEDSIYDEPLISDYLAADMRIIVLSILYV